MGVKDMRYSVTQLRNVKQMSILSASTIIHHFCIDVEMRSYMNDLKVPFSLWNPFKLQSRLFSSIDLVY